MLIEKSYPPNIDAIDKKFHVKNKPNILYTFGPIIYNPSDVIIPHWLVAHEEVHWERQMNTSPEAWWQNYIDDDDYRYNEELLAHQREYQVFTTYAKSRNERRLGLKGMAKRLSSDIYGNCVDFETAKWNIKNG